MIRNMNKRHLTEKEKQEMRGNITAVLQSKELVVFAYLFGSFVGDSDFQDIDIAVYLSDFGVKRPLDIELALEAELEAVTRIPVDVRVINNAPLTFVYNVLKSGSVLLDRDALIRADFEGRIYKEYFDFRHLREEYLREIAHAPV